jgi:VWFA-related protein
LLRFRLRRPVVVCAAVCAILVTVGTAQQDPPQFRTGIDLTRVEVTVLDKRTRKPITGLTADDFIVKVSGDVQRVATLAEVLVAGPAEPNAAAFTEAAHDVTGNEGPRPRLFLILMNDADGENDPFDRQAGKEAAHRLIDGLGPEDQAAVVFTRDNRHAQDFTADRTLLRRAVERFNPMYTAGLDRYDVLERARDFMAGIPAYRRAIVWISPVPRGMPSRNLFEPPSLAIGGTEENTESALRAARALSAHARVSHVPIYVLSTHGLHAPTARDMSPQFAIVSELGRNKSYETFGEIARTIANDTGGRAIVASNAPASVVPAVFEELSFYYALAYESTHPPDGRRRWLDIQVKHPDAMVMPSRVVITTARPAATESADAVLNPRRESGLFEALGAALPAGDVPLRLSSLALPVKEKREQAVALTLGLPPVPAGTAEEFRVRLLLFDGEGRRELRADTREVKLTGSETTAAAWTEVALRLDLLPGRYQLRLAADRKSTQTAGSVHATLVVPDFAQDALSISGVAIGRAAAPPVAGREALADLLPFAPTTARNFARGDKVGALLTVHQPTRRPAQAVLLEAEIIAAAGSVVHAATRTIAAEAFSSGGVEHRFELPLAALSPGDYLLRFVAAAGDARAQRDVRFSVEP